MTMKRLTNKEKEIMDLYWQHGPMFVLATRSDVCARAVGALRRTSPPLQYAVHDGSHPVRHRDGSLGIPSRLGAHRVSADEGLLLLAPGT